MSYFMLLHFNHFLSIVLHFLAKSKDLIYHNIYRNRWSFHYQQAHVMKYKAWKASFPDQLCINWPPKKLKRKAHRKDQNSLYNYLPLHWQEVRTIVIRNKITEVTIYSSIMKTSKKMLLFFICKCKAPTDLKCIHIFFQ